MQSEGIFIASADVATIYAGLGEVDEALRWIRRGLETRDSPWLPFALVGIEPGYDPLLGEPECQAMARSLGLAVGPRGD